jgi:hypothetical protein
VHSWNRMNAHSLYSRAVVALVFPKVANEVQIDIVKAKVKRAGAKNESTERAAVSTPMHGDE